MNPSAIIGTSIRTEAVNPILSLATGTAARRAIPVQKAVQRAQRPLTPHGRVMHRSGMR